jgi:hypothetical protein
MSSASIIDVKGLKKSFRSRKKNDGMVEAVKGPALSIGGLAVLSFLWAVRSLRRGTA